MCEFWKVKTCESISVSVFHQGEHGEGKKGHYDKDHEEHHFDEVCSFNSACVYYRSADVGESA